MDDCQVEVQVPGTLVTVRKRVNRNARTAPDRRTLSLR